MMIKSTLKRTLISLAIASFFATPSVLMAQPQTMEQKAAYTIGSNFIQSLKMQGVELDVDSIIQGIQDGWQ